MRLLRYEPHVPNFGDDLNELLWSDIAPQLFNGQTTRGQSTEAFVGIGTIVGLDPGGARRLHVFTSGVGYAAIDRWQGLDVRYHCVRGPLTAKVLGLEPRIALTDGAILSPLAAGLPAIGGTTGGRVVVVPHYETVAFRGWQEAAAMAGFALVDPRGSPRDVISALAGAKLVLTESLHGAILADTYGVPWRAFAVSRNFSIAKWTDWTASLDLTVDVTIVPPPDPMPLLRFGKRSEPFGACLALELSQALAEFRDRTKGGSTAQVGIMKGQAKRLLEAFPASRRLLGFSPERTAHALGALADAPSFLSDASRRQSLRDEMLGRLHALVRGCASEADPQPISTHRRHSLPVVSRGVV